MDIDECAYEELNTCVGGLYPDGVDIDLYGDGLAPTQSEYYPVPLDVAADGSFVSNPFN